MRAPAWLFGAVLVVASCGLAGIQGHASSVGCTNVPSGACEEQGRLLTTGLAGVTDVLLECRAAPPCTRADGAGIATIGLANGQTIHRPWSYVGDPVPPQLTCLGLALPLCQSTMTSELDGIPPSEHVAGVSVTCTSVCTDAAGDATIRIVMGDGSVRESTVGWSSN